MKFAIFAALLIVSSAVSVDEERDLGADAKGEKSAFDAYLEA